MTYLGWFRNGKARISNCTYHFIPELIELSNNMRAKFIVRTFLHTHCTFIYKILKPSRFISVSGDATCVLIIIGSHNLSLVITEYLF